MAERSAVWWVDMMEKRLAALWGRRLVALLVDSLAHRWAAGTAAYWGQHWERHCAPPTAPRKVFLWAVRMAVQTEKSWVDLMARRSAAETGFQSAPPQVP
jgi:hypothetical protein